MSDENEPKDATDLTAREFEDAVANRKPMRRTRRTASDAAEVPVPVLGVGTGNQFPEPAGTNGNRWEGVFEPLETFLSRVQNEPEPAWLIPDLLPDRGKVFIVAEPSAGKTWLALLACKSASSDSRDVFLVEEEGSGRGLGWRLKALNMAGRVHIAHAKSVLIDDSACRAELVKRIREAVRPVVVFDPFTSLHSGNENDTEHSNAVRRHLTEVANANPDSLVIVCHHTSKNLERSAMYAGRGSSVFAGWTDVQLNLTHLPTKKEEHRVAFRVLLAKSREGHRGLVRDLLIDLATGEVETSDPGEATAEELDELILAALENAPAGLEPSAIPKVIKRRKGETLARCRALSEAGTIESSKSPNGKKVLKLVAESTDQPESDEEVAP